MIEILKAHNQINTDGKIAIFADITEQNLNTLMVLGKGKTHKSIVTSYLVYEYKGNRICLRT